MLDEFLPRGELSGTVCGRYVALFVVFRGRISIMSKAFAKRVLNRSYLLTPADKFRSAHHGTEESANWRLRQTGWQHAPT